MKVIFLNILVEARSIVRISYTSKLFANTTYKAGQGAIFRNDFGNNPEPLESDGVCQREVTSLLNFQNSKREFCGRKKIANKNVAFVVQIEIVESTSKNFATWSWYLGLPFRSGYGGAIFLDGVVVRDFIGTVGYWDNVNAKLLRIDMQISSGYHVIEIYAFSATFDASSVYFSRENSSLAVVTTRNLISALTDWTPALEGDPATYVAVGQERATCKRDVERRGSLLQFQFAPLAGQYHVRLRSLPNPSCIYIETFNSSSRASMTFLPTGTVNISRTSTLVTLLAARSDWGTIPDMKETTLQTIKRPGVVMASFTGRLFLNDITAQSFNLDLTFSVDNLFGNVSGSALQFHADDRFFQPSGLPVDWTFFYQLKTSSNKTNTTLAAQYKYTGSKPAKMVGGRTSAVYLPGASLITIEGLRNVTNVRKGPITLFNQQVFAEFSSTIIVKVSSIICRNSPNEKLIARIAKNGTYLYDGTFTSSSDVVTNGSCEFLNIQTIMDTSANSIVTISMDVTTSTSAGYQLKMTQGQLVVMERGALLSYDDCVERCNRHYLCKTLSFNNISRSCMLFMNTNQIKVNSDFDHSVGLRPPDSDSSLQMWTRLSGRNWESITRTKNNLIPLLPITTCSRTNKCDTTNTPEERCRISCHGEASLTGCLGFIFENGNCYSFTSQELHFVLRSNNFNSPGATDVHINIPSSCRQIKLYDTTSSSAMYVISTSTGFFWVFCDMLTDYGKGYTIAPCDFGSDDIACVSTFGPGDMDTCKSMGMTTAIPRSPSHFAAMHQRFGAYYFDFIPGISNSLLNKVLSIPSQVDQTSKWSATDGGIYWLRDTSYAEDELYNVNLLSIKKGWLGMHSVASGQSVEDGVTVGLSGIGSSTDVYLCSLNDVSPVVFQGVVLEHVFDSKRDVSTWSTSWNERNLYQLCNDVFVLGGRSFTKANAFVENVFTLPPSSSRARITFTLYLQSLTVKPFWAQSFTSGDSVMLLYMQEKLVWQVPLKDTLQESEGVIPCSPFDNLLRPSYGLFSLLGNLNVLSSKSWLYHSQHQISVNPSISNSSSSIKLRFVFSSGDDFDSSLITAVGLSSLKIEADYAFRNSLGVSPDTPASSCAQIKLQRDTDGDPNPDGLYYLKLDSSQNPFRAYCSHGWLVAQRRGRGSVSFNRKWTEYREGFGVGTNEWWIGNEILSQVSKVPLELKVSLSKKQIDVTAYYSYFHVDNEANKYMLSINGYDITQSTLPDAFKYINNTFFSTPDADNDFNSRLHCARNGQSGFWYNDCNPNFKLDMNAPFGKISVCSNFANWFQGWCASSDSIVWGSSDGFDGSEILLRQAACLAGYESLDGTCVSCPAGSYMQSVQKQCQLCPDGTYNSLSGKSDISACLTCPAGYWCGLGSTTYIKCEAGTYAKAGAKACNNAPEGFITAIGGATENDLITCNNGSYSKAGEKACSPTPAGFFCSSSGQLGSTMSSLGGCQFSTLRPCPSANYYCVEGNTGPLTVPAGYYSVGSDSAKQKSATLICPIGSYCQNGVRQQCPPSRYGNQEGLVTPLCSGRCSDGCICDSGSISACPMTASSSSEIVFGLASITHAIVPLQYQPPVFSDVTENNQALIRSIVAAESDSSSIITSLDVYDYTDIGPASFSTIWPATTRGFGHNITIKYIDRGLLSSQDSKALLYEMQLPMAGFESGVVVSVDDNVLLGRSWNGTLTFSFHSSPGIRTVRILAAEPRFTWKRSILFRRGVAPLLDTFHRLRCDLLDMSLVYLQLSCIVCGSVSTSCPSNQLIINDRKIHEVYQSANVYLYAIISGQNGSIIMSKQISTESVVILVKDLKSCTAGDIAVVIGISITSSTTAIELMSVLESFGAAPMDSRISLPGSFIFFGAYDPVNKLSLSTSWTTLRTLPPGSNGLSIFHDVPLIQTKKNYNAVEIPSGYYSVPESLPYERRYAIKACPPGYTCASGIRSFSYSFESHVCAGREQVLNFNEVDPAATSLESFLLANAPLGFRYMLEQSSQPSTSCNISTPFIFNLSTGKISLCMALDYEKVTTYQLRLLVRENSPSMVFFPACRITVNVIDVNEPPILIAPSAPLQVKENSLVPKELPPALSIWDPDAFDTSMLKLVSGGSSYFAISQNGLISAIGALDYEQQSLYRLNVSATDSGGLVAFTTVVVSILDVAESPVCSSATFIVPENTKTPILVSSMSNFVVDPDINDACSYVKLDPALANARPPFLQLDIRKGELWLVRPLNYESDRIVDFSVRFVDRVELYTTCRYSISVTDENDPPGLRPAIFSVEEHCSGEKCLVADLSSFGFDEDLKSTIVYELLNGTNVARISSNALLWIYPVDYEVTSTLYISVIAIDNVGAKSLPQTMQVRIIDVNEAPTAKEFNCSVVENLPIKSVACDLSNLFTDPEGSDVFLTLQNASNRFSDLFILNGKQIVVTAAKIPLNYETLNDTVFVVYIKACDPLGLCTSSGPNTITVIDGPDPPTLDAAPKVSISERAVVGSFVMKASAHDEDFGQTQTLLYSVVSGDPLGHFSINVDTGLIFVAGQLDINSIDIYKLVIKVVDSDGLYALSKPSFDVVILDYPDPPYFADAVFNQKNYQINITQLLLGTKSYSTIRLHVVDSDVDQTGGKCSISQDVASSFELQAQVDPTLCVLVVRPTVTIKVNTCYNVTVKVTDFLSSGTDQMYSEITLEVALFGAYYPPECFDMSFSLLENSPTGSWIGNVIAVDGLGGNAVEYSVFSGNEYDMFRISKSTGDLSVGTNTSDFETATKFILEIEVRDDTVVPLIGTCKATIWILNEIESPQCDQTADFNVPEDAVIEIPVGEALWNHCRDEDSGKRGSSNFFLFEFARTMTADIPFTISNSSGQISVMSNLNYEAKSYYPNLTVVVRNAKSSLHFTYMSVSIMVDDRNDPPEAKFLTAEGTSELTSVIVPENLGIGTVIAQLVLYDEDINETLDASLSTTTTTFRLDHINATTHYILLGGFVDHEMREFYNISIVAWDHEGALKKSSLDIIIADVNEKPWILSNQHFFIEESAKAGQLIQTLFNQRGACDLTTTAIALVSHCNSLPSCMSACASRSECFGGVYQTEKAICRLTDRILQDGAGCTVPCADCEMFERLLPTAPGELIQQDSYLTNDAPLKAALISMHSLSIKMPFHPYTLMHLESWPLLSKFTVDGWINLQQNEGSLLTLYLKQTNRSEKLLFLQWIYSADTLQITLGSASLDTRYRMDKSVWYHIATTFSSDTGMLNIYIDGSRVIQQNLPTSVVLPLFGVPLNPEVIIFGTCFDELMCPSKPFSFWIDEVRCWSEEKTHEFLRNVYNKVITYPDASLISYHRYHDDLACSHIFNNRSIVDLRVMNWCEEITVTISFLMYPAALLLVHYLLMEHRYEAKQDSIVRGGSC